VRVGHSVRMMQSQVRPHLPVVEGPAPCSDAECLPCVVAIHGAVRHISAFLEAAGWVCGVSIGAAMRAVESEWVAVHPVHPDVWPAGARACAEVWYFLPEELRADGCGAAAGESLEAAEFRIERMGVLAQELMAAGYEVAWVDRGWLGPNLLAVT
jgi:hypothetical protein